MRWMRQRVARLLPGEAQTHGANQHGGLINDKSSSAPYSVTGIIRRLNAQSGLCKASALLTRMTLAEARANFARGRVTALIAFALGCLAGCSTPWQSLPPATVASDQFQDMSCERLKSEKVRLGDQAADLSPSLFPTGGEEQRKRDLAKVDGKIVAIGKVQADKKCPGFTNGVAPGIDPSRRY